MSDSAERWDTVIAPHNAWWKLDLSGIWQYRDLLLLLVRRDLLATYKQTILGPLWQVIQPLLQALLFAVIFGLMARLSVPGIPPLLFYLSGIVPWTFFSTILNRTAQTFVTNSALMTKVYFPRLVAPLATTLSASVSFAIQLACFFVLCIGYSALGAYDWQLGAGIVALPVLILLLMLLAFGSGVLVAALTTKFRDLGILVTFGVQLLMYMSPVIFPLSRVTALPLFFQQIIRFNPITPIIEGFRSALFGLPMDWGSLVYTLVVSVVLTITGIAVFQRVERSFADVI